MKGNEGMDKHKRLLLAKPRSKEIYSTNPHSCVRNTSLQDFEVSLDGVHMEQDSSTNLFEERGNDVKLRVNVRVEGDI